MTVTQTDWRGILVPIALEAGEAIMKVYGSDDFEIEIKSDRSPVTAADNAAHEVIAAALARVEPRLPILSEESRIIPYEERASWPAYWLVDPLDGTKEFIRRNGEFTVNIALIIDGRPVAGVVHAPALDLTYFGQLGRQAVRVDKSGETPLVTKPATPGEPLRVVASRSHASPETEAFLDAVGAHTRVPSGSSLKFCRLAEGSADVYPRLAPTMEWDTGAAQAVLEAAGGAVQDVAGEPLRYNKENLLNPHFVASADPAWLKRMPRIGAS